ncbi:MAG: DNA polymerase, partial [Pseudomonadota bacterium]
AGSMRDGSYSPLHRYRSQSTDGSGQHRSCRNGKPAQPIQGSAADIIRRAMIRLPKHMASTGRVNKMLLQVHDELLFEVEEDCAETFAKGVQEMMQAADHPARDLAVPLVVESGFGSSWANAH